MRRRKHLTNGKVKDGGGGGRSKQVGKSEQQEKTLLNPIKNRWLSDKACVDVVTLLRILRS